MKTNEIRDKEVIHCPTQGKRQILKEECRAELSRGRRDRFKFSWFFVLSNYDDRKDDLVYVDEEAEYLDREMKSFLDKGLHKTLGNLGNRIKVGTIIWYK